MKAVWSLKLNRPAPPEALQRLLERWSLQPHLWGAPSTSTHPPLPGICTLTHNKSKEGEGRTEKASFDSEVADL